MLTTIFNSLAIFLSLSTSTGILLHDTKIDKAVTTALATPLLASTIDSSVKTVTFKIEPHSQVERVSFAKALVAAQSDNPRIQPRTNEDKKYQLPKNVFRGHHAFDNYNLPIV